MRPNPQETVFLCSVLMTETLALTELKGHVWRRGDVYHLKAARINVFVYL